MNTTPILSLAWQIVRRQPLLWLLGFLVALQLTFTSQLSNPALWQGGSGVWQNLQPWLGSRGAGLAFVLFLLALCWLVGLLAQAALIQAVVDLDEVGKRVTLGIYGRRSVNQLGQLILLQGMLWLPLILLSLAYGFWLQRPELPVVGDQHAPVSAPAGFTLAWLLSMALGLLPWLLYFVDIFAYRAIVLDHLAPTAAIRQAIRLLVRHLQTVISTVFAVWRVGILPALGIALLLLPFVAFFFLGPLWHSWQTCGGPGVSQTALATCFNQFTSMASTRMTLVLIGITASLLSSALIAYISAVFTLLYRRLTGPNASRSIVQAGPYTLLPVIK